VPAPAAPAISEEQPADARSDASLAAGVSLEELAELSAAAHAAPAPVAAAVPTLRVARLVAVEGRKLEIAFRGAAGTSAELAAEVEPELIVRALADKEAVLVEVAEGQTPVVVGVLATRLPREVFVRGETIHVEAEREILLRAGRAALRLREDGDVELGGSRISAASRGLFRLVGRILRLN
jgi:hypothetical protein